ncbi:hypothetical protein FA95DRAFT_1544980 [Auriscalpium vulgare]|uniref:Uncharacterized protein n=1 Tax=Auriscalpium vulgare TaxID=40419 RepID=A0ACB8RLE7_9AGAM|nr:hypothetical protein FA95DRAFT_1544980 [Auriscalpium vulgare]
MADTWPQQLKDWVASCLGQMTDANRDEAQNELRQVISDAFSSKTLWTTDWAGVQLKRSRSRTYPSLLPITLTPSTSLKRKIIDSTPTNATSKKAKKSQISKSATTNALDMNDRAALNRRAERFQREHEIERQKSIGGGRGQTSLKANHHTAHVFNGPTMPSRSNSPYGPGTPNNEPEPIVLNWDRYTIVGTSEEIFKDYLRLTSEPKAEQIRPYKVLQQTLAELKKRWKEKVSYAWVCSQFKSLRQDLTVQRIKNEFTVTVYEIHARMALEVGDMVEYNQCQGALKSLYELGIPGKTEEFTAYRILMLLHGRNSSELNLYVGQLTPRQKADAAVQHALAVQRAMAMGNYHAFFECYITAPNMGGYIMDHFVARERVHALLIMSKAYQKITVSWLVQELAFDDAADACKFLEDHRAATYANPNSPIAERILECRSLGSELPQVLEEKYRKVQIKGAI